MKILMSALLMILLPWLFLPQSISWAESPVIHDSSIGDCGTISIAMMARILNRPLDYLAIEQALPVRPADGYALSDLEIASNSLGLSLHGYKMTNPRKKLDRPIIALLKMSEGGHYVMVRPLSEQSSYVQILDPPFAPKIYRFEEVTSWSSWTGLILAQETWSETVTRMSSMKKLFIVCVFFTPFALVVYKKRNRLVPD